MYIKNVENFPIVSISHDMKDAVSVEETLKIYEILLNKQQYFVFKSDQTFPKFDDPKESHEDRKKIAAWVKENRDRLSMWVKGIVHIEPNQELRLEAQKFAQNFIKFSGYPMFVVENEHQSAQLIESILKKASHSYA